MTARKTSLRQRILSLKKGEAIIVPVAEYGYTTIRTYASDLSFSTGNKYSASRNREDRTYTITRTI